MPSICFWNTNRNSLHAELSALVALRDIDILVLAESGAAEGELIKSLYDATERVFLRTGNINSRLKIYSSLPPASLVPVGDSRYMSVVRVSPPLGADFLLAAVHLPSKLHLEGREQYDIAIDVVDEIERYEIAIGHDRTIVVGDFNMGPFEDALVAPNGFHAVMDREIARRGFRTLGAIRKKFFYNPMWSLMGDIGSGPPGTYYYDGSRIAHYWNTFDQVICRPSLIDSFQDEQLEVISEIDLEGSVKSLRECSDHFPIVARFVTELNTQGERND